MAAEQRLSPTERSNLVAYLDGELADHESRVISTKLTQSVTARRELEVLEKTWALLDHLPRPRASEHLTERTLTQAQSLAEDQGRRTHSVLATIQRIIKVIVVIGMSACFVILGAVIVQLLVPNPTSRLAHDLSIAEHFENYRDVGSFEFLKQLENSPQFLKETDSTLHPSRP